MNGILPKRRLARQLFVADISLTPPHIAHTVRVFGVIQPLKATPSLLRVYTMMALGDSGRRSLQCYSLLSVLRASLLVRLSASVSSRMLFRGLTEAFGGHSPLTVAPLAHESRLADKDTGMGYP